MPVPLGVSLVTLPYLSKTGAVKKINGYEYTFVILDGAIIPINNIVAIDEIPFCQREADS